MSSYADASRDFFAILDDYSPLVEPLSLDEGFVDVTGGERLLGDAPTIARAIKQRVRDELRLVVSVGVAPTKFIAKIASDIDKPDGLRVVERGRELEFLHPLPLSRLWGVGKVTQEKLTKLGLRTIGDVANYPENVLCGNLGPGIGAHIAALARGEDPRRVDPNHSAVSIGHEQTFETDLSDKRDIASLLLGQADRVAARLRSSDKRARIVVLKLTFADFRKITRRRTLPDPTCDGNVIGSTVVELLEPLDIDDRHGKLRKIRLCGVSASGLESRSAPLQLMLDEGDREKGERLGDTLDAIHEKFRGGLIKRAAVTRDHEDD